MRKYLFYILNQTKRKEKNELNIKSRFYYLISKYNFFLFKKRKKEKQQHMILIQKKNKNVRNEKTKVIRQNRKEYELNIKSSFLLSLTKYIYI